MKIDGNPIAGKYYWAERGSGHFYLIFACAKSLKETRAPGYTGEASGYRKVGCERFHSWDGEDFTGFYLIEEPTEKSDE